MVSVNEYGHDYGGRWKPSPKFEACEGGRQPQQPVPKRNAPVHQATELVACPERSRGAGRAVERSAPGCLQVYYSGFAS
jgi:hypothetical protein